MAETMSKSDVVQRITEPLSPEKFIEMYWPARHYVCHGEANRHISTLHLPENVTVEDIVSLYKNPIMVVGDCVIDASEGITDRFMVSPSEALHWYEQGGALEFDFVDLFIPSIRKTIQELKSFLKLPQGTHGKAVAYAAKNGGGFKAHFDAYANFVFQIRGRKKWMVLENSNVTYPVQHYDLAEYPYMPVELKAYWNGQAPDPTLPNAHEIELQPGSMLFLPRGYWHSTESQEETLAINITFGQATWIDFVLAALRQKLVHDEAFRSLAYNIEMKSFEMNELLKKLPNYVGAITEEDLLQAQSSDLDLYQTTQLVFRQYLSYQ
ncbi:JmjC domain-containing protein [Alicyclobacillus suci]|uniref:JmjC domain-containing protein n=1 Tax=Alicyclobacillus suci TaxID=2816080 RepID=UPI001F465FDC|nr:cupin domain-containing protein [Alicyclobacillus suci]